MFNFVRDKKNLYLYKIVVIDYASTPELQWQFG